MKKISDFLKPLFQRLHQYAANFAKSAFAEKCLDYIDRIFDKLDP